MYSGGSDGFGLAFLVVMARRVARKEVRATLDDLVDSMVVKGLAYILGFGFLIQI